MTQHPTTVLHVSPHPDDELLGAPATLMGLRDAGWRVVNLACSLGRPGDVERRRTELSEACRRAGFDLVLVPESVPIGRDDDLGLAQARLAEEIARAIEVYEPQLVVGPSLHDDHHGHAVVGRAIIDAVQSGAGARDAEGRAMRVMFWSLWRDLPEVNTLVPFKAERLDEIQQALAAHAGELARNRFDRLLEGRAKANAVLGPERVFGRGSDGRGDEYAELLWALTWEPGRGWEPRPPVVCAVG